jgi:hypothetical protein
MVGGDLFATGLNAHAPSQYKFELGRKWESLEGFAGLADGHDGSVGFRIEGDGRELWRSDSKPSLQHFRIDVAKVDVLSLNADNGGNGKAADWVKWTDLLLTR